jgi:hypothetical protein
MMMMMIYHHDWQAGSCEELEIIENKRRLIQTFIAAMRFHSCQVIADKKSRRKKEKSADVNK